MGEQAQQFFAKWYADACSRTGSIVCAPPSAVDAFNAALELAIGLLEVTGCNCHGRQFPAPKGGGSHWTDCPIALAANLRNEIVRPQQTKRPGDWELVYHRMT